MKRVLEFIRLDGHLIRISVRGEGDPLLLIMGLGGNIEMWNPLERVLNANGIQTIAYDASGTGDSPPRLVPKRMPGLARQAARVLDALGHPTAAVLGVSFGGAVAQEMTLANPHRVKQLFLASTMCGLGGIPGNPLALSVLSTPLRYYSPAFLRATANIVYGPIRQDGGVLDEQASARRSRPPSLWGYVGQLTAISGWSSMPWLHRIRTPTLVVSGRQDPIVPPLNARILHKRLPNSELMLVDNAGHLVLLDHADEVGQRMVEFMRRPEGALAAKAAR